MTLEKAIQKRKQAFDEYHEEELKNEDYCPWTANSLYEEYQYWNEIVKSLEEK